MEVAVIDSASHEWEGKGGCLEINEQLGGRFQDWAKVTPRHRAFIDKILHSDIHVISTTRKKTDFAMESTSNGKVAPKKVGLKDVQRDGWEYELTTVFDLETPSHLAKASKDRTGLFMARPHFIITEDTGREFLEWSREGKEIYRGTLAQKQKLVEAVKAAGFEIATVAEKLKEYSENNLGKDFSHLMGSGLLAAMTLWAPNNTKKEDGTYGFS
jgi:hypothetical protein